jgi:protein tyrosine/serine phosphatase
MNSMKISSNPKGFRNALFALTTLLFLASLANGQDAASSTFQAIKIKNFGQMDERFFRGAQPKQTDYKDLAILGIKTVIDLRADPEKYERPLVEALGMKYVNIPMVGKKYPTPEATELFLKTINDPSIGKFFVHCAGGRHRTGAMGAVYRFQFYNWNYEQVYKEMKQYDFYTSWGHGAFKDFVQDYYARIQKEKATEQK